MLDTKINGCWSLLLPEHRAAREEWATGWEVERLASMHDLLRPGMVLYDIGTEEGDLSALFARWVADAPGAMVCEDCGYVGSPEWESDPYLGPPSGVEVCRWCRRHPPGLSPAGTGGGIVLCEPNARVWPNVRAIWEANNLPAPLGFVDGFVADAHTFVDPWSRDWPASASGPVIGDHGFCRVEERPDLPRTTIDMLALRHPPDAITMDVEGAELLVLRGAARVLAEHRPIVWASVHPEFMAIHYGHFEAELIRYMRDAGYSAEHLAYDHEHHWLFLPEERS